MAKVTNVKTVDTKEQKGVLVEYLVERYGQSADFFIPDGAILDGQIDSRRVRSGMPVEYMSKDGKDFDWGQYSEDVEIQKRIANAFVYSFATFRKQGRGLYIYSSTKGSGKTLLACCLANEVLKKQDVSIKFITIADYIELVRSSKNEAVKEQMNAIMNTGLLIVDDIGATKEDKISPLVLGIRSAITSLIGVFTGAGGLSGAISIIVTAFDRFAVASNVIPIAIALAVAAIVLIITHWDQLKAAMSKLMDWIKGVFSVDWNAQLGVLGEGIEVLLSTVKGIFNSIKQIFSGFITFLKGAFTGNIDMALKGVLGILRGSANLISSIFKTPVNEVIALFNAMGQAVVKGINNLIDGLNHIKVPDWVPGIGGKGIDLSHANFTRVPYLAQGAVIPAGNPFLAVLGDQTRGNNLEMPENLLRKIVSEESGKGTGMIKLVVNLDSRTVLEQLINTAKEMQMSNGQNVFELGR